MLNLFPASSNRNRQQRRSGWTLVEMLVAVVAGVIIVGSVTVTTITVTRTMQAIANYTDLNNASRNTLDVMSREIRSSAQVTNATPTSVTCTNLDGTSFTYAWNGSSAFTRTYVANGTSTSTVMLTNCDYLSFSNYQRNPTNNFQFIATTNPPQIKLISVSWRCSRQIFGAKLNTESVQTAQIAIRN